MSSADRAMCTHAEKLTHRPWEVSEEDVQTLRAHGFSDRAVHDVTHIVALFNCYNRLMDGLGVEPEEFTRAWEERADPRPSSPRSPSLRTRRGKPFLPP